MILLIKSDAWIEIELINEIIVLITQNKKSICGFLIKISCHISSVIKMV